MGKALFTLVATATLAVAQAQADLKGQCHDPFYGFYDQAEFEIAVSLASASNGFNLGSQDAKAWAASYSQTHACDTITEYASRFDELYTFAYDPAFLDLGVAEARQYALSFVESLSVEQIRYRKQNYGLIYDFFYNPNDLNRTRQDSIRAARAWVERSCGGIEITKRLISEYRRNFEFANSSQGLSLDASGARAYALPRVRYLTRCSDLL